MWTTQGRATEQGMVFGRSQSGTEYISWSFFVWDRIRGWSKSRGWGGPEENGGWFSKFRALAKGGSPQFSASGRVGHDSF